MRLLYTAQAKIRISCPLHVQIDLPAYLTVSSEPTSGLEPLT